MVRGWRRPMTGSKKPVLPHTYEGISKGDYDHWEPLGRLLLPGLHERVDGILKLRNKATPSGDEVQDSAGGDGDSEETSHPRQPARADSDAVTTAANGPATNETTNNAHIDAAQICPEIVPPDTVVHMAYQFPQPTGCSEAQLVNEMDDICFICIMQASGTVTDVPSDFVCDPCLDTWMMMTGQNTTVEVADENLVEPLARIELTHVPSSQAAGQSVDYPRSVHRHIGTLARRPQTASTSSRSARSPTPDTQPVNSRTPIVCDVPPSHRQLSPAPPPYSRYPEPVAASNMSRVQSRHSPSEAQPNASFGPQVNRRSTSHESDFANEIFFAHQASQLSTSAIHPHDYSHLNPPPNLYFPPPLVNQQPRFIPSDNPPSLPFNRLSPPSPREQRSESHKSPRRGHAAHCLRHPPHPRPVSPYIPNTPHLHHSEPPICGLPEAECLYQPPLSPPPPSGRSPTPFTIHGPHLHYPEAQAFDDRDRHGPYPSESDYRYRHGYNPGACQMRPREGHHSYSYRS